MLNNNTWNHLAVYEQMIYIRLNYYCLDYNTWNYLTECKQMSSGLFKNVTIHLQIKCVCIYVYIYIYIYIYIYDLALNNHQGFDILLNLNQITWSNLKYIEFGFPNFFFPFLIPMDFISNFGGESRLWYHNKLVQSPVILLYSLLDYYLLEK